MKNILLIEPDTVLGRTYKKALEEMNHEVTWCQDAQSAINAVDTQLPDVIVAELQMAAHNGVEFLYELRSYPEWQNVPIIVNSQVPINEMGVNKELLKKLGVVIYSYKPFTKLSGLLNSVNQTLSLV